MPWNGFWSPPALGLDLHLRRRARPENREMKFSFLRQRHVLLTSFDIFVVTCRVTNFLPKLVNMLFFSMEKNEFLFFEFHYFRVFPEEDTSKAFSTPRRAVLYVLRCFTPIGWRGPASSLWAHEQLTAPPFPNETVLTATQIMMRMRLNASWAFQLWQHVWKHKMAKSWCCSLFQISSRSRRITICCSFIMHGYACIYVCAWVQKSLGQRSETRNQRQQTS